MSSEELSAEWVRVASYYNQVRAIGSPNWGDLEVDVKKSWRKQYRFNKPLAGQCDYLDPNDVDPMVSSGFQELIDAKRKEVDKQELDMMALHTEEEHRRAVMEEELFLSEDGKVNREVLGKIIEKAFVSIKDLNDTKGREYAGDHDALANFSNRAAALGITPFQVWGIFFGKHSDAIYAYLRSGRVLSEPIEGRIDDAILYLLLLKGLILQRELKADAE